MRSQVRLDFWAAPHTFYHDPFLLTNSWASPNHTLTMFSKNGAHSTKPRAAQQDLSDPGSLSLSFPPVPHFSSSPTGHGWTDTWSPGKVSHCRESCSALCTTSPLTSLDVFPWSSGLGSVGLRGTASSLAADVTQRWSGGAGGFYSLKKHLPLLLLAHGAQVNPQRITKTVTKKQASAISDKGNRQQQERDRRINCRDVSWEKKSIRMSYRRTMLYLKP